MTDEQAAAIARLVKDRTLPIALDISQGTRDLPPGYVCFAIASALPRSRMFGGISPEGDVST